MKNKAKHTILAAVVAAALTITCSAIDDAQASSDAAQSAFLLSFLATIPQPEALTYQSGCLSNTLSLCSNYYANTAGRSNVPFCSTLAGNTARTELCGATSAVGVCIGAEVSGARTDTVYYSIGSIPFTESSARTSCANSGGTFDANYNP